ncbi:Sec-independent protein translocase protein TatB [Endozoicomonas sp. GU-1]|uniref:Sec-independent protein translocase protein TatB n=1 Tax=Endozoicomonas sp. GU-1 TaxID=3009078 RepID=UPI0022B4D729|nr:Sec-independent protein translocase protein TatB [Endozoicomonas sp. GU-1]WBA82964.1 Sec-independent protein translocase protein TatB [Endozoicomonas sp. GU-1]WBA85890.1 Sec-independent protein translocase protein TatB [Endozoicomonas sp. GU-1]
MLDIGFTELLLVAVIALVVLGPERLPQAIRTTAYWVGKIRRSFQSVKEELEREIDADGIKQQLHNEAVMKELNKTREQFQSQINDLKKSVSIDPAEDQTSSGVNTSSGVDGGSVSGDGSVNQQAVNDTSARLSQEKGSN